MTSSVCHTEKFNNTKTQITLKNTDQLLSEPSTFAEEVLPNFFHSCAFQNRDDSITFHQKDNSVKDDAITSSSLVYETTSPVNSRAEKVGNLRT